MPLAHVISLTTHTPLRAPALRLVTMAALNGNLFLPKRRSVWRQRPMQRQNTPATVAGRPGKTANRHATLWRPLVATGIWLPPNVADFVHQNHTSPATRQSTLSQKRHIGSKTPPKEALLVPPLPCGLIWHRVKPASNSAFPCTSSFHIVDASGRSPEPGNVVDSCVTAQRPLARQRVQEHAGQPRARQARPPHHGCHLICGGTVTYDCALSLHACR